MENIVFTIYFTTDAREKEKLLKKTASEGSKVAKHESHRRNLSFLKLSILHWNNRENINNRFWWIPAGH